MNDNSQERPGLISAMGTGFEIVKKISYALQNAGGTEEDMRRILSPQTNLDLKRLGQLLVGKLPIAILDVSELTFEVDPGNMTVAELVQEMPFVRRKITADMDWRFDDLMMGPVVVKIVDFKILATDEEEAYSKLKRQLLAQKRKLATIRHFLAFVGKYPSVAAQVMLEYPHKDLYIRVYGGSPSNLTIRWESSRDRYLLGNSITYRCLEIVRELP